MPRQRKPNLPSTESRRDLRPDNFYLTIDHLGLRVISHSNEAVTCNDGVPRWLPRDLIGRDGKTVVIWRHKDREYGIDGWEPWHDGMFGGRYQTIGAALHWVKVAKDVRAGRRADFMAA